MSIKPLWPNLQPRATDPLWFNADRPCDDESEVAALEAEHQSWRDHVRMQGYDHIPLGKTLSDFRGSEEEEEEEEEEEGEGEEEEESETHEEEEEELDEIDMEVSYSHQQQRSSPTDTVTDPVSIRMCGEIASRQKMRVSRTKMDERILIWMAANRSPRDFVFDDRLRKGNIVTMRVTYGSREELS